MSKVYSIEEVGKHNTLKSLWVIFNDKVYDVTDFASDHPGGDELMIEYGGKDITQIMSDTLSHEHSESAFEILEDYLIGILATNKFEGRQMDGQRASIHRKRISLLEKEVEFKTYGNKDFKPSVTDTRVDVKVNQFLDLNKPLIPQMLTMKFTKAHYLEQVHKPRYLNRPADFFGHPLLEPLTKTVWWVVPMLWLPYAGYNIYQSSLLMNPFSVAFVFVLGIFIWSLLEYSLHRFLFHFDDHMPESQLMFTLHFALHGFHHYLPMDRLRLVVPPALFVVLAYPWVTLAHTLFSTAIAHGLVAGAFFGYICYDMTHYYLHHAKVIPYHFAEMKKYHLAHHYKDFEAGYGITSKFWDYVFKTVLSY